MALYLLERPVTNQHLLNNMMKVDFDNTIDLKDGEKVTAVGLGYLDNSGSLPAYLQKVDLKYVANWRCRLRWPYLSSDMLCATDPNGGSDGRNQDSCSGDSGGPLLVKGENGAYKQVGIVSYGSNAGCGVSAPGVYSRVSESSRWP